MNKLLLVFLLVFICQLFSRRVIAQNYSPVWVNDIGGGGGSAATAVVTDKSGNVYITGRYGGTAIFNLKQGGNQTLTSNGGADIFIAKYDPVAGNYIWAIGFGGSGDEHPTDMALDNNGNVIIEGQYESTINFNPKGSAVLTPVGAEDVFFAKYDSNGNYVWAKSIGEPQTDRGVAVATDANNNVFISGVFQGTMDADPAGGNFYLTDNSGEYCQFLAKYDSNGNIVWAHALPGNLANQPDTPIKVDQTTGDVIMGGAVNGTFDFSFNGTAGATITSNNVANYLVKYSNTGIYEWVKNLAINGSAGCYTILVTPQSNVLLDVAYSGTFYPNGPTGGNQETSASGGLNATIISYTSAGVFNWEDNFGGASSSFYGNDICLDNVGNIVMGGSFNGTIDFGAGAANGTMTSAGSYTFFISKYDPNGKSLIHSSFGGNCSSNVIYRLAANSSGVYPTGGFCGTDNFDPSPCGTDNITASGTPDAFVAKYIIATDTLSLTNTITAPADSIFCTSGDPAAITGNTPAGTGVTFTYQWQSSTNGTAFINISGATAVSYDPPMLTATTYYQRVVTSSCGISNSNVVRIVVNPPPPPPASIIDTTCQGSSAILVITGQTGFTYNWYDSPAKTNLLYTGVSFTTPLLNANTTYYIEAFNGACGSASLATAQVTVTPLPAAPSLVNTPVQVCAGTPATFTIANPQPGYTYNWYNQATGGSSQSTGTSFTVSVTLQSAAYFAEAANQTGCVSATRTEADLTVIQLPDAPQVDTPATICSGSVETLSVLNPQAGLTYNWYSTAAGGNILAAGDQYTTPPLTAATTYYAEAVSSTGGCPSATRTAVTVQVTPIPSAPASGVVTTCTGTPATLTITDAVAGITYSWYDSAGKTNLLFTGTVYVTGIINTNTTFYVQAADETCTSPTLATFQVNVTPLPVAPSVATTTLTTCSGTQVTLSITGAQAGYTYNWYTTATGGTASGTGVDFTTPALSASVAYYAEAVNSNGCISATRTPVNITIAPLPDISATGASACPNTSAVLSAQSIDANTSINWYAYATGGTVLYTGSTFTTPEINTTTSYYAEAVDKTTQCVSSQRAVATASILTQLITPVVTVENTSPTDVTFQWAAVPGAAAYKVSTDNGETFADPSSGSDGLSTTINGLQVGQSVTIIVEALADYSCQTSAISGAVTAIAQYPQNDIIYVANAFTPNGDGKNDIVYVHGNSIQSMNFHIYDQFGELIFTSTSLAVGWNGTYKGTIQPVGVYVYYVQAKLYNGQNITKKGTITLLK